MTRTPLTGGPRGGEGDGGQVLNGLLRKDMARSKGLDTSPVTYYGISCSGRDAREETNMFKIVLIDSDGNLDSYAAGDPTPGRGANEFASREDAEKALVALGDPADGERWEVRPQ